MESKEWLDRLRVPGYDAVVERAFVVHVEAFDWNCPQHITPRFTEDQLREALTPLEMRMRKLEEENAALRAEVVRLDGQR